MLVVILSLAAAVPACMAGDVDVETVAGLREALASAAPGTTVRLAPGEYELAGPLVVPDHVVVEGSGTVVLGGNGSPAGWQDDRVSTLRVRGPWSGNAVELGHGSALRRLRIVDESAAEGGAEAQGEARNLVVVAPRRPGDWVAASVVECEVSTQQPFGSGVAGPLGRAVAVWTRNRGGGGPPDAEASARLTIERSVIRAPRSNALFAINFAPRGQVAVDIQDSRLEGVLSAAGGTSLRDHVTHALTTIRSRNNEYVAAGGFDRFGWHLFGGSGVPHPQPGPATPPGADDNRLRMESDGDRIEGFQTGILAAAGRRVGGLSGSSSGNHLELETKNLVIVTDGEQAADILWFGALAEPSRGSDERLPPGQGNLMTVRMTGTIGSGPRANHYADVGGLLPGHPGAVGNQLRVLGTPGQFRRHNPGLSPAPGDEFFHVRGP